MKALGNILWHVPFCGFMTAIFVWLLGGLLVITVIGAPLGAGLIQFSKFLFAPYSYHMISDSALTPDRHPGWKAYRALVTICYLPFGLFLFCMNILQILLLCITVIGIPLAIILAKSSGTLLNPVNKICVSRSVKSEIESRQAKAYVDRRMS